MSFDAALVAERLAALRASRGRVEPMADGPRDDAEGAAAQVALARAVRAYPPPGFKIGATGSRMQAYLGLTEPAAGFMEQRYLYGSGVELPFSRFVNPGVECEVVVRLGRDLPAGPCTPEQAGAAVGEVMAGIEIVENRYGELRAVGTPLLVADQMFHAAGIIGAPGSPGVDLGALKGRILIDGVERDAGVSTDLLGHPLNCLAWLAGSRVAEAFGGLRAGQVIMLGSVVPVIWMSSSERVIQTSSDSASGHHALAPVSVEVVFEGLPSVALTLT